MPRFSLFLFFFPNVSGVEFVSLLLVYFIFNLFFLLCVLPMKTTLGPLIYTCVSEYVIPVQFKPPSTQGHYKEKPDLSFCVTK